MPPSFVGTKSLAGQAWTHALVVQLRQSSESTTMCGVWEIRKSTVSIRSSKAITARRITDEGSAPVVLGREVAPKDGGNLSPNDPEADHHAVGGWKAARKARMAAGSGVTITWRS